jgi:hypothetical protein
LNPQILGVETEAHLRTLWRCLFGHGIAGWYHSPYGKSMEIYKGKNGITIQLYGKTIQLYGKSAGWYHSP